MPILTEKQIREGYFYGIGGFPSLVHRDYTNYAQEVKDYKGQEKLCIACTQLESHNYSKRDQKRILDEWLDFLKTNTKALKALHFNSHVPQRLLDAACHQENLEELFLKWGNYKDLSVLDKLRNIKYLRIGTGSGVQDIEVLGRLSSLVVLSVENFKRVEDYSPIARLDKLEQLIISGPTLGRTPMKDYEFLREMPNLLSVWFPGVTIRKKYTRDELSDLFAGLPNLMFMHE
jgi:hypothetical protein